MANISVISRDEKEVLAAVETALQASSLGADRPNGGKLTVYADSISYNTAIAACANFGEWKVAVALLRELLLPSGETRYCYQRFVLNI